MAHLTAEDRFRAAPGLRVVVRMGPERIVRTFALVLWIYCLILIPSNRTDLLHPSRISSDTSNYVASGERFAEGRPLYALTAGDRPAPADNAPDWTVPILSPPPLAMIWAGLDQLPWFVPFHLVWMAGLAGTSALWIYLALRAPLQFLVPGTFLAPGLALTSWSGNVNALIGPGMAAVWMLTSGGRSRRAEALAGVIVALAAVVKLGPAILGIWLLSQRRFNAVISGAVVGLTALVATAWIGGIATFGTYLTVARDATATPSPVSIPGIARSLGFGDDIGRAALLVMVLGACVVIVALRAHPRATFAVAVVASVGATAVVRYETWAMILAALVPWIGLRIADATRAQAWPRLRRGLVGASIGVAMVGAGVPLLTDGNVRSTVTVYNATTTAVVVRFGAPAQDATFGFRVEPGTTGAAWIDQPGTFDRDAYILDVGCDLMTVATLPSDRVSIQVGGDGVHFGEPASGPFLAYSAACAKELRSIRGPQ